jgi:hypothetical protein
LVFVLLDRGWLSLDMSSLRFLNLFLFGLGFNFWLTGSFFNL